MTSSDNRSLGFVESCCKIAHDCHGGYNVVAISQFETSQILTEKKIRQAFDLLLLKYHMLNVYFFIDSSGVLKIKRGNIFRPNMEVEIFYDEKLYPHVKEVLHLRFNDH